MSNHLKHETSPYLLQHAENPVAWYPWGEEAFQKAKAEDKPVFLSIGYSTCHWCHVMAHESFEDEEIAALLNEHFISVKVDREERPDIDSVYMSVCQAFTGSGGWPTSIFMTPEQKPFFAGTYFPKTSHRGMVGMKELLTVLSEHWTYNRSELLQQADEIVAQLGVADGKSRKNDKLTETAVAIYKRTFDGKNGGFGRAPKFPAPHNLIFLLEYDERYGDKECLKMAEHTLIRMYRGGMFDHIGYGFCRYSTDERFLVPHFEKMLYDNALLIMAYCKAYDSTQNPMYLHIAEETADYILREMTGQGGGFYSAQDADSEGEEGLYYLFTPEEMTNLLGEETGHAFNRYYGISPRGNFEGKSIPNLLGHDEIDVSFAELLSKVRQYRKERYSLHLDDKVLTLWNSFMIAAMCALYRASGKALYLTAAQKADHFLQEHLCQGDTLYVSYREGRHGVEGFLDDYAGYIFAQLALYGATLEDEYLCRVRKFCEKVFSEFRDEAGGFYMSGKANQCLILRPKETYDGAIPSGNSLMAWNLVRLSHITGEERYEKEAARQLDFLAGQAGPYPTGHAFFLSALLQHQEPPDKVTVVPGEGVKLPVGGSDMIIRMLSHPTEEYPLKEGKTTYYVCRGHQCLPPVNDLAELKWHEKISNADA